MKDSHGSDVTATDEAQVKIINDAAELLFRKKTALISCCLNPPMKTHSAHSCKFIHVLCIFFLFRKKQYNNNFRFIYRI